MKMKKFSKPSSVPNPRRKRGKPYGQFPNMNPTLLAYRHSPDLDGDTRIILCSPLTPTLNVWLGLHWAAKKRYEELCWPILRDQLRYVLGPPKMIGEKPWFSFCELSILRCSNGTRRADDDGVIGGVKRVRDLLTMPNKKRPGLGIVLDDDPDHMKIGSVEDRARGHWLNLRGPATWLILKCR